MLNLAVTAGSVGFSVYVTGIVGGGWIGWIGGGSEGGVRVMGW